MGTPVPHNTGKPIHNSPCKTRRATAEELAEVEKKVQERNPFGINVEVNSPTITYDFPKKIKSAQMATTPKQSREDYYAKRKAQMQENVEKCRQLAEQGFTKHEISNKTGIAVKTIEKYALKNGFKYAHKPITVKEKIEQVKSIAEDIKIQQKRNMSESKPIMKAAEGLSESIQKGEVKFPLEDLIQPDGAVDLEKLMGKLEKEDVVNRPSDSYYEKSAMQPLEVSQVLLTKEQFAGALLFNVIKYQMRKNHKGQKESDEYKARQYAYWLYLVKQGKKIDPSKDIVPSDFDVKVV